MGLKSVVIAVAYFLGSVYLGIAMHEYAIACCFLMLSLIYSWLSWRVKK